MTAETLWRALEAMPVRSGVEVQWRDALGDTAPAIQPFLETLDGYATSYPCPEPGSDGCPRRVVEHDRDDIVAVCQRDPLTCETITLAREDIVIRRLDLLRLAAWLRDGLDLRGDAPTNAAGLRRTAVCGIYRPVAGREFRVYVTIQPNRAAMTSACERLLARETEAFALIVPTTDHVASATARQLTSRGAAVVALPDFTGLGNGGALAIRAAPAHVFASLHEGIAEPAGEPSQNGMADFATPGDATWSDVNVRFTDSHTVSVDVLGTTGRFSYAEMGMVNRKTHQPTLQWELLRTFANRQGWLIWSDRDAHRNRKKQCERLVRDLRAFFRITEGRPIVFSTQRPRGWRVEISLSI